MLKRFRGCLKWPNKIHRFFVQTRVFNCPLDSPEARCLREGHWEAWLPFQPWTEYPVLSREQDRLSCPVQLKPTHFFPEKYYFALWSKQQLRIDSFNTKLMKTFAACLCALEYIYADLPKRWEEPATAVSDQKCPSSWEEEGKCQYYLNPWHLFHLAACNLEGM